MWIVTGQLGGKPWVIVDDDDDAQSYSTPDDARLLLAGHALIEESEASGNGVWIFEVDSGEVEEF